MRVVADASPLILLARIRQLDLLEQLFERIHVPAPVLREVEAGSGQLPGTEKILSSGWIVDTGEPTPSELLRVLQTDLDAGESAALHWGVAQEADLVLIDERRGRRLARQLGLKVQGTLGIVTTARKQNILPELRPVLLDLIDVGAWLSQELIQKALAAVGED